MDHLGNGKCTYKSRKYLIAMNRNTYAMRPYKSSLGNRLKHSIRFVDGITFFNKNGPVTHGYMRIGFTTVLDKFRSILYSICLAIVSIYVRIKLLN